MRAEATTAARACRAVRPACTNASLASGGAGDVVAARTRAGRRLRLVLELGVDHVVLAATRRTATRRTATRATATRATLAAGARLLVHGLGELVGGALQLLERRAQRIRPVGVLVGLE